MRISRRSSRGHVLNTVEDVLDTVELVEPRVGLYDWLTTVDHKRLGLMYIATALMFFVVGGALAAVMRAQLAFPDNHLVPPDVFNRLFTMHGTTMVFLVGMPFVAGLANYLVPLMIGARDMAF